MNQNNEKKGFSLLEVLAAFALLSILLTAIIQSQGNMLRTLEHTGKLSTVIREVRNELLKAERMAQHETISISQGEYQPPHELAGSRWEKMVVEEPLPAIGYTVKKVIFRVVWSEWGQERAYEDFLYLPKL